MSKGLLVRSIELVEEEGGFNGYHLTIEVKELSPNATDLKYPEAAELYGWEMVSSIVVENANEMRRNIGTHPEIVIKANAEFGDITATPEAARKAIVHFAKYILNAAGGD